MVCLHCGHTWEVQAIDERDTGYYGPESVDCPACDWEGTPYDNLTSSERYRLETLQMPSWKLRELKAEQEADDLLSS